MPGTGCFHEAFACRMCKQGCPCCVLWLTAMGRSFLQLGAGEKGIVPCFKHAPLLAQSFGGDVSDGNLHV